MSDEKGGSSGFLTFMVIITFLIAGAGLGLAIYLYLTKDTTSSDTGNTGGGSGGNTGDTNDSVCRNTCASFQVDGTMKVDKGIISAGELKVTKTVSNIFDLSAVPTLTAEFIGNVKRLDVVDTNVTNRLTVNNISTTLISSNSVESSSIVGGYRVVPQKYTQTGNYNIEYYLDELGNLKSKSNKTGDSSPIYENKLVNYHFIRNVNTSNFIFIFKSGLTKKIIGFTFEIQISTNNNDSVISPQFKNENGKLDIFWVVSSNSGTGFNNLSVNSNTTTAVSSSNSANQYSHWKVTVVDLTDNGDIIINISTIRYQA